MNWVSFCLDNFSEIIMIVGLIAALVRTAIKAVKEKNWSVLTGMAMTYMKEAEKLYAKGSDRKDYVMAAMSVAALTVNYPYDSDAEKRMSAFIDDVCSTAKVINTGE